MSCPTICRILTQRYRPTNVWWFRLSILREAAQNCVAYVPKLRSVIGACLLVFAIITSIGLRRDLLTRSGLSRSADPSDFGRGYTKGERPQNDKRFMAMLNLSARCRERGRLI